MASPRLGVVSSVQLAEGSWGHWPTAPPAPPPPTTGTVGGGGHVDTTHCPHPGGRRLLSSKNNLGSWQGGTGSVREAANEGGRRHSYWRRLLF